MFGCKICKWLILGLLLTANATILAQAPLAPAPQESGKLLVKGYPGEAGIVRVNGRAFVDLEALVKITGSSVAFERGRVVLTLPSGESPAAPASSQPVSTGFSRPFVGAGIEALASMREWGSTLAVTIRNGFPLGNAINPYRARAAEKVYLAAAAASTEDDRSGLELLRKELSNVQAWSDKLVNARNSMSAANLAMSENAMQEDPMFQSALHCGQYLAQMLASGSFHDAEACR
jgi:hypothetical protein